MTENNVKDPRHYKIGNFETIDLIQEVVEDFGSVCQANILKYGIRANRKHDNPKDDINKIIRYCEFWLNHLNGKKASEKTKHSLATFHKLNDMLAPQEKDFLKNKKILHIRVGNDNLKLNEEEAKNVINILGRAVYDE